MKALPQVLVTLIVISTFGLLFVQVGEQLHIKQMQDTYKICMAGHRETSGESEKACGDAQDKTHTEFMCDKTGDYCWLEVR